MNFSLRLEDLLEITPLRLSYTTASTSNRLLFISHFLDVKTELLGIANITTIQHHLIPQMQYIQERVADQVAQVSTIKITGLGQHLFQCLLLLHRQIQMLTNIQLWCHLILGVDIATETITTQTVMHQTMLEQHQHLLS